MRFTGDFFSYALYFWKRIPRNRRSSTKSQRVIFFFITFLHYRDNWYSILTTHLKKEMEDQIRDLNNLFLLSFQKHNSRRLQRIKTTSFEKYYQNCRMTETSYRREIWHDSRGCWKQGREDVWGVMSLQQKRIRILIRLQKYIMKCSMEEEDWHHGFSAICNNKNSRNNKKKLLNTVNHYMFSTSIIEKKIVR